MARAVVLSVAVAGVVRPAVRISIVPCVESAQRGVWMFGWASAAVFAVLLGMLEWSWIAVLTMDPGSLEAEVRRRGLRSIERFEECRWCLLPKPPRCHHCSKCGTCILYMDHHCQTLGRCLAYRNFKAYLLVFFYGAAAAGFGSCVMFVCVFLDLGERRGIQFFMCVVLAAAAVGMVLFARFYLEMKRNNVTTIEEMFGVRDELVEDLPNVAVFEKGWRMMLPLPSRFNPFEPFVECV